MSAAEHDPAGPDAGTRSIVALQIGRPPREPWRVHVRCAYGHPSVIASPVVLEDGSRFPTLYWLTCPWLVEAAGALESEGAADSWGERASRDLELAAALEKVDAALRQLRAAESGGEDPCADVGLAGQKDPLGVKCVHAHVAFALAGLADPIGEETLARVGYPCEDERCALLCEQLREPGQGARP